MEDQVNSNDEIDWKNFKPKCVDPTKTESDIVDKNIKSFDKKHRDDDMNIINISNDGINSNRSHEKLKLCGCNGTIHKYFDNCILCGYIMCTEEYENYCICCGFGIDKEKKSNHLKKYKKLTNYQNAIEMRDKLLQQQSSGNDSCPVYDLDSTIITESKNTWAEPQFKEFCNEKVSEIHRNLNSKIVDNIDDSLHFISSNSEKGNDEYEDVEIKLKKLHQLISLSHKPVNEINESNNSNIFDETSDLSNKGTKDTLVEEFMIDYESSENLNENTIMQNKMKKDVNPENKGDTETEDSDSYVALDTTLVKYKLVRNRDKEKSVLQGKLDEQVVISISQPYASLIINGLLCNFTKSWSTDYRGWLWIHADETEVNQHEIDEIENKILKNLNLKPKNRNLLRFPKDYVTSALVGRVELEDVTEISKNLYKYSVRAAAHLSFSLRISGKKKLWLLPHIYYQLYHRKLIPTYYFKSNIQNMKSMEEKLKREEPNPKDKKKKILKIYMDSLEKEIIGHHSLEYPNHPEEKIKLIENPVNNKVFDQYNVLLSALYQSIPSDAPIFFSVAKYSFIIERPLNRISYVLIDLIESYLKLKKLAETPIKLDKLFCYTIKVHGTESMKGFRIPENTITFCLRGCGKINQHCIDAGQAVHLTNEAINYVENLNISSLILLTFLIPT